MKNFFATLFGRGPKADAEPAVENTQRGLEQAFVLKRAPEEAAEYENSLRQAFVAAIQNSPHVKPSGQQAVLAYLMHETKDLLTTGTLLTAEEKKALGYNSRSKITHESLAVLTQEAIEAGLTPGEVIHALYIFVTRKHQHFSNMSGMKQAGIKRYVVMVVGTGQECAWCKSMNGKKLEISQDFQSMAELNCTNCPPCIYAVKPILDWDD
jgi:hypothetical protein